MYDYVVFAEETAVATQLGDEIASQLDTAIEGINFKPLYQPFIMLLPTCIGLGCVFAGIKKGLGLLFSTINRA